jgi:excisionase family DNA binding protein
MNEPLREEREELSITEAAKRKKVHPFTLRRWIAEGRLPGHRFGPKLVRVYADDLDKLTTEIGGAA